MKRRIKEFRKESNKWKIKHLMMQQSGKHRQKHMQMKKIKIYTTRYCPYCIAALKFLSDHSIDHDHFPVDENIALRKEISTKFNWPTVPIILIEDHLIGGYTDLLNLHSSGKLPSLLNPSES